MQNDKAKKNESNLYRWAFINVGLCVAQAVAVIYKAIAASITGDITITMALGSVAVVPLLTMVLLVIAYKLRKIRKGEEVAV